MASSSKSGRQGSGGPINHVRIEDEQQMAKIYQIKGPLGEGSFGVVREVVHVDTGERCACKAINKEKAGSSKIKLLEREVTILKRVQHEHIIQLKTVFETAQRMYLVMELCEGGELSKELKKKKTLGESAVRTIMGRLASAISYLHKHDMVHRDLKLENILLSQNPNDHSDGLYIKVTDFGLSVVQGSSDHENLMMDFCGTPMYMAPEIIENKTYGQLCDVWAMGVIMYMLVTGNPPFVSPTDTELYDLIKSTDIQKLTAADPHWKKLGPEAQDLIQGMLNVDPAHRYTAREVLHHSWVTGKVEDSRQPNVLQLMKEWGPSLGRDDDESITSLGNSSSETAATATKQEAANGTLDSRPSSTDAISARKDKHNRLSVNPTQPSRKKKKVPTATLR